MAKDGLDDPCHLPVEKMWRRGSRDKASYRAAARSHIQRDRTLTVDGANDARPSSEE